MAWARPQGEWVPLPRKKNLKTQRTRKSRWSRSTASARPPPRLMDFKRRKKKSARWGPNRRHPRCQRQQSAVRKFLLLFGRCFTLYIMPDFLSAFGMPSWIKYACWLYTNNPTRILTLRGCRSDVSSERNAMQLPVRQLGRLGVSIRPTAF